LSHLIEAAFEVRHVRAAELHPMYRLDEADLPVRMTKKLLVKFPIAPTCCGEGKLAFGGAAELIQH